MTGRYPNPRIGLEEVKSSAVVAFDWQIASQITPNHDIN
jgi:hypothetical protein